MMGTLLFLVMFGGAPIPRQPGLPRVQLRCIGVVGGGGHPHQHRHEWSAGQADKRMRKGAFRPAHIRLGAP